MDLIDKGYGVAYRCHSSLFSVVAPVPLNWLVAAAVNSWWWARSAPIAWESPRQRVMRRAYRRGYERGLSAGRRAGLESWQKLRDRELVVARAEAEVAKDLVLRIARERDLEAQR